MSSKKAAEDYSDAVSQGSNDKIDITGKLNLAGQIDVADTVGGEIVKEAALVTAKGNIVTKNGVVISTQEDDASLSTNIFADPEVKAYYVDVYEKASYECRHVFDADLTWTKEEKRFVRRLDWQVCLWACVMFFSLQIDRGNTSQAVSRFFLKDLHLNTNGKGTYLYPARETKVTYSPHDFNLGNTVFRVSFLLAGLFSQLISKKLGLDR